MYIISTVTSVFEKKIQLIKFLEEIEDFNRISYHLSKIMVLHFRRTRGQIKIKQINNIENENLNDS